MINDEPTIHTATNCNLFYAKGTKERSQKNTQGFSYQVNCHKSNMKSETSVWHLMNYGLNIFCDQLLTICAAQWMNETVSKAEITLALCVHEYKPWNMKRILFQIVSQILNNFYGLAFNMWKENNKKRWSCWWWRWRWRQRSWWWQHLKHMENLKIKNWKIKILCVWSFFCF